MKKIKGNNIQTDNYFIRVNSDSRFFPMDSNNVLEQNGEKYIMST